MIFSTWIRQDLFEPSKKNEIFKVFELLLTCFIYAKVSVYDSHVTWQMRIWKHVTSAIIRRATRVSMVLLDVAAVEFRRSPPCIAAGFSSSAKIDEILWWDQMRAREQQLDVRSAREISDQNLAAYFLPIVLWLYIDQQIIDQQSLISNHCLWVSVH